MQHLVRAAWHEHGGPTDQACIRIYKLINIKHNTCINPRHTRNRGEGPGPWPETKLVDH
jgi:hypothetical protein